MEAIYLCVLTIEFGKISEQSIYLKVMIHNSPLKEQISQVDFLRIRF